MYQWWYHVWSINGKLVSDVEILIIMVANEVQAESVLYGNAGAVPGKVYY